MISSKKIAKMVRSTLKTMGVNYREAEYDQVNVRQKVSHTLPVPFHYQTHTHVLTTACGRSLYKHLVNLEKAGL